MQISGQCECPVYVSGEKIGSPIPMDVIGNVAHHDEAAYRDDRGRTNLGVDGSSLTMLARVKMLRGAGLMWMSAVL